MALSNHGKRALDSGSAGSMKPRLDLWSSGGGVQSTAIAVLILKGRLPRPDLCVIADTEREKSSTWNYLDQYVAPAFEAAGLKIHRVRKSDYNAPDIYDRQGKKELMPFWTTRSGALGKLPTWCSTEWKRDVIRRFARSKFPERQFRVWMGISYDEPKRIRVVAGKWQTWYPLYDNRIRRSDCVRLVLDYGWPLPRKSACFMCPNHRDQDWREMQIDQPKEFEKAVQFERLMDDDELFLHEAAIPLDQAMAIAPPQQTGNLFDTERCDSGFCFV